VRRTAWGGAAAVLLLVGSCTAQRLEGPEVRSRQLTRGPGHHFFGYIGHASTVPWNASGRLVLALRTTFQDRLPGPDEAADVVLLDAEKDYAVRKVDETRAWNFQQGTMFFWNPAAAENQFFFNDRDPRTGRVFCVLYDVREGRRVREYRFDDTPVGNGGVSPKGDAFAGINYGRLAKLRPVTGYPGAFDWTDGAPFPADDGVFRVDIATGRKTLLVSFARLRELLRPDHPSIDEAALFVNHTLWNRQGDRLFFFVRGGWEGQPLPRERRVNASFVIRPDGTGLTRMKSHIGGHPEWESGSRMIGRVGKDQVLYDVDRQELCGTLGTPDILPDPEGDVALSPDGSLLVNGYRDAGKNRYVFFRRADGAHVRSGGFPIDGWTSGPLRIDPAPSWNRRGDRVLFPAIADDAGRTRQLFLVELAFP
jgi:hypothetical protein